MLFVTCGGGRVFKEGKQRTTNGLHIILIFDKGIDISCVLVVNLHISETVWLTEKIQNKVWDVGQTKKTKKQILDKGWF